LTRWFRASLLRSKHPVRHLSQVECRTQLLLLLLPALRCRSRASAANTRSTVADDALVPPSSRALLRSLHSLFALHHPHPIALPIALRADPLQHLPSISDRQRRSPHRKVSKCAVINTSERGGGVVRRSMLLEHCVSTQTATQAATAPSGEEWWRSRCGGLD
jgi:hypothetical protein